MTRDQAIDWLKRTSAQISFVPYFGLWEATKLAQGFVFAGKGDTFEEACQQLWLLLDDLPPESLIEKCPTCGSVGHEQA